MGVVVLDLARRRPAGGVVGRPPVRAVAGVPVGATRPAGATPVSSLEVPLGGAERALGARRSSMSPMWAGHPGQPPVGEAEGVLEVAADGQRPGRPEGQVHRQRRVAAGAADRQLDLGRRRATTESSHGTWIGRSWASQASARPPSRTSASVVVGDDRLAGQRCRWSSPARAARARRRAGRAAGGAAACTASITPRSALPGRDRPATRSRRVLSRGRAARSGRPGWPRAGAASAAVSVDEVRASSSGRDHHRERLVPALLALAQRRRPLCRWSRRRPGGSRRSLHRDDRAVARAVARASARASSPYGVRSAGADQAQPRPAVGAADRSARGSGGRPGSAYSRRTGRAHREAGHRRGRPVVREPGDDRVARAAVGAGDERVPVAPVARVAQVGQAVVADGDVRSDEGAPAPCSDARITNSVPPLASTPSSTSTPLTSASGGAWRPPGGERLGLPGALDLDDDAVAGVPDRAGEVETVASA